MNKEAPRLVYPWDAAPASGTVREVAPGVKWLYMQLPFALTHINLWLLRDGNGWTIVDTGIGNDATKEFWEQIFANELEGLPVTRLICTHFHVDHFGLAGWLCERWGIDLWMTAGEFYTARAIYREDRPNDRATREAFYRSHGVDEAGITALMGNNRFNRLAPIIPPSFRRISGGAPIVIGGREWIPIIGRGHAPEHACLWCPEIDTLIAGDIILPRISPNVSVRSDEPLSNPLKDYLGCLPNFAHLPGKALILPSHGLPFHGVHERIADLRIHHDERLKALHDFTAEPRCAVDCFPILFKREITPDLGLMFAVGESLAHLHYLEAENQVRRERDSAGIWRFSRA